MFYDLLHSPDGVVSDVRGTARLLVDRLGFLPPKESWYQTSGCHGYEALFTRVHGSRVMAPSRIEVIDGHPQRQPSAPTDIPAYIDDVSHSQGARPAKTHATVLTSSHFEDLRQHLLSHGVRHRVDPPSDDLGHERLWIGYAPDEGPRYVPDDDGGIRFEVIPTQCLELPETVASGDIAALPPVAEGSMIRIVARSYLVEDLPALLATLESRLGWPAEQVSGPSGARCAVMAANFPRSARFELWEPGFDPDAAEFYARWGPGTFATRISVRNLDVKAGDLAERGVSFRHLSPSGDGGDLLRVDQAAVPGFLFDFVDE